MATSTPTTRPSIPDTPASAGRAQPHREHSGHGQTGFGPCRQVDACNPALRPGTILSPDRAAPLASTVQGRCAVPNLLAGPASAIGCWSRSPVLCSAAPTESAGRLGPSRVTSEWSGVAEFGPWPSRPLNRGGQRAACPTAGGPWREPETTSDANEKELQDLVKASATLLPDTAPSAVVDEFWVPEAGTVDLLVVDRTGGLPLVECKLRANPGIRREVVGQILAYAGGLSHMPRPPHRTVP